MVLDLAAGTLIASCYRLERCLGEGGMGVVWAATDLKTDGAVALKLSKDAPDDPDARRRFAHEARAAAAVLHPHVVRILDVLEHGDGTPVIVLELLEGETLREALDREHRFELAALADILVPVMSAVGAAHALGVVHRDLKPENIFLSRGPGAERVVKVLDFGIAKLTALDGDTARSSGVTTAAVLGTPAYMAPEQVFGESDVDHRADVWALGLILYQCVSGVLPTRADNLGQVLKNVLTRPFEPLDRLVDVPDEIADLAARMLARERSQRPGDLREPFTLLQRHARATAPGFGPPAPQLIARAEARNAVPRQDTGPAPRTAEHARLAPTRPTARRGAAGAMPRRARPGAVGAAIGAAVVAAGLSVWRWTALGDAPAPVHSPSPLAAPSSKIACPVLRASGIDEPAGWLGAAAAVTACERIRLLLGGRAERTLVPAELLDLPRGPVDSFPDDPYGRPGARERSIAAAQQRAQAYLDGEVTGSATGFSVALSLHRSDGSALGTAVGSGAGLYEAVRSATAGLIAVDLIPRASALAPEIARWARTAVVDDALGALDLTFALAHNAGGLPAECLRFHALAPRLGELGLEGERLCADTLGQPPSPLALDASDRSDAAVATRIRIAVLYQPDDAPETADLPALFQRESSPRGRSLLAATESCRRNASDPPGALEWAITAVQVDPKTPDGGRCNPWEQLTTLERDMPGGRAAVRAMQAWAPWNSYAWLEPGFEAGGSDPATLRRLRRARALSPLDAYLADLFATSLLAAGEREEARGVATQLRNGGLPLHDIESSLIFTRIEASQALFAAGLARARKALVSTAGDVGWIRVQRFEIAWHALELAVLLGRGAEVADLLVARFLDPEPVVLEGSFTMLPLRVAAICARSSAPAACFARVRALRPRMPGAITAETDAFLVGAERYTNHDLPGAARAWRPLMRGSTTPALALPEAMVDAFEHTGAIELAAHVDEECMAHAGEFNGATSGHVRAARRALARGDRETAQRLAEQVIAAWSVADEPPPAVAEMHRLLARLPAR